MSKKKSTEKLQPSIPQRITGPRSLQSVPGFKDRVGIERAWWGLFQKVIFEIAQEYNFYQIHPSSVEYTTNFTRSLGKDHPLVAENLFTLLDPNQEHISLRPCFDISYLKAYYTLHKNSLLEGIFPIEHWYSLSSVFGNKLDSREIVNLFISVLGNDHPVVDAECTVAAYRFLQSVGFDNMQVLVNSIGAQQSQQMYKQELVQYYRDRKKELCEDCQPLISRNPLQLLVCPKEQCKQLRVEAPQSVDWLTEDDKEHFIRVLEYLDELEIPYLLAPELVPTTSYNQKTLVSIKMTTEETSYILAHGGRYDGLSKELTEYTIPAMKMTVDLDKCLTAIRSTKLDIPEDRKPQIFLAQLGDAAKKRALSLREELHQAGIETVEHFGRDSIKLQLEQAVKMNVKYTCILGQKEILDGTILIRDMEGGIQEEVPLEKLVTELKKRVG